ncbi:hypothetical protein IEQ34_000135 [Dendrobium chrysotoxum]|uniref:Uncharacterized protein n=1 Tax=Dendrobium chrysotoxum TaxID=161865 RepID=A0AAV7HNA6_DENCH|nr:hypothetical protein IEQ34_000135 [Dendrobium chrysotoxum]
MGASPIDRCPAVRHRHPAMSGRVNPGQDRTNGVRFDKTIRTECVGPDRDRFAGGGGRCGVDVMLELSLGLSSGKVECRKWARESNETVGVKKPKMEEGPMPYCLQVMPTIFIGLKGYYYAYMMPCWVLISMKWQNPSEEEVMRVKRLGE